MGPTGDAVSTIGPVRRLEIVFAAVTAAPEITVSAMLVSTRRSLAPQPGWGYLATRRVL